jgi:dynein heavy chain
MEDLLNDHNATSKRPMKLAMFLCAAEHISRACHILKQYRDAGVIVTFC